MNESLLFKTKLKAVSIFNIFLKNFLGSVLAYVFELIFKTIKGFLSKD